MGRRIAERYQVYEFSIAPMDWGPRNAAWSSNCSVLFYVEEMENGKPALRRIRLDETSGPSAAGESLATGRDPGDRFLEPRPSPDGTGVAYVVRRKEALPAWELHLLRFGLEDGRFRTLEEVAGALGISRERVRQTDGKALRKLRRNELCSRLKACIDGA